MTAEAVEARGLTKSYGSARGITDIDLTVHAGEVMGLVGVNGAGKTTFMRTLLDFIHPTSGSLHVFGKSATADSVAVRRTCTYLPGEFVVPSRLTGYEAIRRFTFTRTDLTRMRVDQLAQRLDVDLSRRVRDLSKGNKQKVGLVLAFAPTAQLIVLDEPTSGLDPLLQRTFAELVKEATDRGSTVLLSSHVMSEVEQIAQRVALLSEGRLAVVDDIVTLLSGSRRRGSLRPAHTEDAGPLAESLARLPGIVDVRAQDGTVTFACSGQVDPIIKCLAGYTIDALTLAHADLEDAFFSDDASGPHPPAKGLP